MAVEQKKPRVRVSKNRKKSWNKYCDIKDVEKYLEDKRFEERIGGSVFEKSFEDLGYIQTDSGTNENVAKDNYKKKLRCFQNIGAYTHVPSPHNRTLQPFSKKIKKSLVQLDKKHWKKIVSEKKFEKKADDGKIIQKGDMYEAEIRDLWTDEAPENDMTDLIKFRDEYTKKRTPRIPAHRFQKPSLLPAVEVPHSGASYNPTFLDHQELVSEAVKIEEAKLKKELHLKRVLTDMFPSKDQAPTAESILAEMSQGLYETEVPEEEVESSFALILNKPIVPEDRLSRSRRRKRKERKAEARKRLEEKLQKHRLRDVFRIKSLKKEIKNEKEAIQKKVTLHAQRKIDRMYKPHTLSAHKYEAPDLEVKLGEELCDSLRNLKAEGSLLEDRYKSLQRRNLIEPRIQTKQKRKYKLKVQIKRSHRNFQ